MPDYTIHVNGEQKTITADADTPLLWAIREQLGLTGTKYGCGKGYCGACTVHFDGRALKSCVLPVSGATNAEITTVEGLAQKELHPVQKAWISTDTPQCGYCQPGQIMAATALLAGNPNPSEKEIQNAMAGNICRCGTYPRILKAIKLAIQNMNP